MSDLAPLAEAVALDPLVGHPADYHVFHKFIERCKALPASPPPWSGRFLKWPCGARSKPPSRASSSPR